jgi:hypothetical protein
MLVASDWGSPLHLILKADVTKPACDKTVCHIDDIGDRTDHYRRFFEFTEQRRRPGAAIDLAINRTACGILMR